MLVRDSNTGEPKKPPKLKWTVGTPLAMGVRDRAKPADTKIHVKGESSSLGEVVPRGFLTAVSLRGNADDETQVDPKQSGRLQLARWLTQADNPLTARVMVNRLWQQMFGVGLVRTPDDFGTYGERPTDPQLLDHLASRFVAERWSIKRLVRAIALSRTYQLAVEADDRLTTADPQNLLFARHDRRRLTAEALRDAVLLTSGRIDRTPGQGSLVGHRDILVNIAGNLHQPSDKRSIYLCYLRSSPPPELAAFDLPEFTSVTARREVSTVPGQALHLYNNPFVVEQSQHFARRIMERASDVEGRIVAAWCGAYGRARLRDELTAAAEFVRRAEAEWGDREKAWAGLCQALIMSNEFRYVD
ncbi:MAG: DUF1553 domain-containing protein [Pirellulales bacterium]